MPAPKIFFSYSPRRTSRPELVAKVIAAAKAAVEGRGWEVIDAMEADIRSISEKVYTSLLEADACIVEATTSVPNVMFEAGLARALDYPTIFLIDTGAYGDASVSEWLTFIGHHRDKPLGADLGDVQYLAYPSSPDDPASWEAFAENLSKMLDAVARALPTESVMMRRGLKRVHGASMQVDRANKRPHPLVGFLGGRIGRFAQDLEESGQRVFATSARYYRDCLAMFQSADRTGDRFVRAIADLSTGVETFWREGVQPGDVSVAERIFLVPPNVFFDSELFETMAAQLLRHAAVAPGEYRVLVGRKRPSLDPLEHGAVGDDLLLMLPDVTALYIKEDPSSELVLRVQADASLFGRAEERYYTVRQRTVEIDPSWTSHEIRRQWLALEGVGIWDPTWRSARQRSAAYFRDYDQHIRSWVPDYDALIEACADATRRAIADQIHEKTTDLGVLEIGYGTGALTRPLLDWLTAINAPLANLDRCIVNRYVGLDAATQMRSAFLERPRSETGMEMFEVGFAPDWPPAVRRRAPYDVVCGALVFTDLVTTAAQLEPVLKKIYTVMSERGQLVLADAFSDGATATENHLRGWRDWMTWLGLSPEAINSFFSQNATLASMLTREELETAAASAGFETPDVINVGDPSWSPFRVIVLRRKD